MFRTFQTSFVVVAMGNNTAQFLKNIIIHRFWQMIPVTASWSCSTALTGKNTISDIFFSYFYLLSGAWIGYAVAIQSWMNYKIVCISEKGVCSLSNVAFPRLFACDQTLQRLWTLQAILYTDVLTHRVHNVHSTLVRAAGWKQWVV